MNADHHVTGGAAIGVLSAMEPWEANLILNLRLWCDGPRGQQQVKQEYLNAPDGISSEEECRLFDELVQKIMSNANRPLVRHEVACACVGADECVFAHLVKTASAGYLRDAALIASLLVRPAEAELIALMAGRVGTCIRKIHERQPDLRQTAVPHDHSIH